MSRLSNFALCAVFLGINTAHAQQVPNTQQTAPGTLLSSSKTVPDMGAMGRLAIMEPLGDYIVTIPEAPGSGPGTHFLNQLWDLSDLTNPRIVQDFSFTQMPYQAHGTVKTYVSELDEVHIDIGGAALRMDSTGAVVEGPWTDPQATSMSNLSSIAFPWTATNWGSYGVIGGESELHLNNQLMSQWDHLGTAGVTGFSLFMGNILIAASDQANTGVASYDISDPTNPVLLDVLNTPIGPEGGERVIGGYQAEIYSHYVVFASRSNDNDPNINTGAITVVDFSDPENLRLHCYIQLPGEPMYVNFQDEHAFLDRFKVHVEDCRVDLAIPHDGPGHGLDMSQYSLPLGNILVAGGMYFGVDGRNEQGMSVWVHQSEPDTNPPYVSYHIPRSNQEYPANLPISLHIPEKLRGRTMVAGENIIIRPVGGEPVPLSYRFAHSGLLTIDPVNDLEANTTYQVQLSGIQDYMGNEMEDFSYEFTAIEPLNQSTPPEITIFSVNNAVVNQSAVYDFQINGVGPFQYRFRANNQGLTEWSSNRSFSFVFDEVGWYPVQMFVRDANGRLDSASMWINVIETAQGGSGSGSGTGNDSGPVQHYSSQLTSAIDSGLLWAVNPDNNNVVGISKSDLTVGVTLTGSEDPRSVVVASDGTIWVAGMKSDSINVYAESGDLLTSINTGYGSAPFGLVADHQGQYIYATLYGSGELARINRETRAEDGRLSLGATPRAIAITPDDSRLLITRFISPESHGQIWDVDTTDFVLRRTIPLYKSANPDTISNGLGVPNYLSSIIVAPNGEKAYYTAKKDNTDKGILTTGADLDDDNTLRSIVGVIDLVNHQELYTGRADLDNRDSPSALVFSPNLEYLLVSTQGNNVVIALRLDDQGNLGQETGFFQTGLAPQGLYFDTSANTLFVKNFMGRSISRIDLTDFLERGALNPPTDVVLTVAADQELLPANVLAGKRVFYNASDERMSAEGYISCASCHADGGHDGRTWDNTGLGEGLRNTASLQGKQGVDFGFAHWSGNFDEIQDFEHGIRAQFKGLGFLSNEQFASTSPLGTPKAGLSTDLDNLATYVTSLGRQSLGKSPYRTTGGQMTSAALRGAGIFSDQSCGSCHSGSQFTDGLSHNVGTLRVYTGTRLGQTFNEIRTPSLLGAFATAPYLHDGSARTLADVFTHTGGTVLQAEDAELEGASLVEQSIFSVSRKLNAPIENSGMVVVQSSSTDRLTFNAVSGGAGGQGFIRLRAMASQESGADNYVLQVTVNDQVHSLAIAALPEIQGEQTSLQESSMLEVNLAEGDDNVIIIQQTEGSGKIFIDDITVINQDNIAAAESHSRVQGLTAAEQLDLVSFIQQLDTQSNDSPEVPNEAPIGGHDSAEVLQNTELVLSIEELLSNDMDANQDELSLVSLDDTLNGTALIDRQAGVIRFTPEADFVGDAQFTYLLSDGGDELGFALVRIRVTGPVQQVNQAPIGGHDSAETLQGEQLFLSIEELLSNDSDPDQDVLTILSLDDVLNGTASLDREAGVIRFVPEIDFVGETQFTYLLSDGSNELGFALVRINVLAPDSQANRAPVGGHDEAEVVQGGELVLSVDELLSNDRDPDRDVLTILSLDDAEHGSASLDRDAGVIRFTPEADFVGDAQFTYLLSDGGDELGFAMVRISVVAATSQANQAPIGGHDTAQTQQGNELILQINELLSNDQDPDLDEFTILSLDDVLHGYAQLDQVAGVIRFMPEAGFIGDAQFTYLLSDGGDQLGFAIVNIQVSE